MTVVRAASELAINGGRPARTQPFPGWPQFQADEIAAAERVLRSGKVNYWTGEEGREFEREHAAFTQVKHAIALANGTVALELALIVLGVGPGDEVLTTSRTFVASASCIAVRGAKPVMVEVDRVSGNVTAETLRPLITARTKAIIVVHLAGWPCDIDPIMALAAERGIKVIEDCAQAHGAVYKGRPVGSIGHVNAFSYCQDKIMSTGGEGGLLTTNDSDLWEKAWSYKDHGKSYDAVFKRQHPPGFRWLHEAFGTNWRLTEMQSAMGRVLLSKLPELVRQRRHHADFYNSFLKEFSGVRTTPPPADFHHSYYRFYCYARPERLREGWDRDKVIAAINAEGVPCYSGACSEIYLEKCFPEDIRPAQRYPIAGELGETTIMLPVYTSITEADLKDVRTAVEKVLSAASA
jgi:dTDP-4-amino-4,6-dideoxygalactose transaminase